MKKGLGFSAAISALSVANGVHIFAYARFYILLLRLFYRSIVLFCLPKKEPKKGPGKGLHPPCRLVP
ncbi:hypothetical protein [Ferruginibacter sp.]